MTSFEIPLKTVVDIARMRRASRIVETIFSKLKNIIIPGKTTVDIERFCNELMKKSGVQSGLLGFKNFPHTICTSINNVAAHGLPGEQVLQNGDIISIDIVVNADGWFGDGAWTYVVGTPNRDLVRLVKATWQAVVKGIMYARPGNRLGDIGEIIQETSRRFGCSVLGDFVGHGIGKKMHEEPKIPHFGKKNTGLVIVPGMVFTIEPILTLGTPRVNKLGDGWAYITSDGSPSAQFEHTIAIFKNRTEILTFSQNDIKKYVDFPPFF